MPAPLEITDQMNIALHPTKGFEAPAVSPPYLRGANILYDPGFEGVLRGTYGYNVQDREPHTGSHTYPIPMYEPSCQNGRWPNGECSERFSPWIQRSGIYSVEDLTPDAAWKIGNVIPRSGQWCAIWIGWGHDPTFEHPAPLMVQGFNHPPGLSARVEPGDVVTWSVYAQCGFNTGIPQITPWLTFFTEGGAVIGSNTTTSNLTASYAQYTVEAGAPSGAHYVRAMLDWGGTPGVWVKYGWELRWTPEGQWYWYKGPLEEGSIVITHVDDASLGVQ